MKQEIINGFQIETDGKTVWVNNPKGTCVGRLCHFSAELTDSGEILSTDKSKMWEIFKKTIRKKHGITISESFKLHFLSYEKPEVQLSGIDGNAISIINEVKKGMIKAGATKEELDAYARDAMSGNFDNVLTASNKYVEVI